MALLRKFGILYNSIIGYFFKWKYDIMGIKSISSKQTVNDVVVSLTSYGRRVEDEIVYYTLLSLLNQTILPERIILWLDESWNSDNIPHRIKSLTKYNLEIRYCKDLRSYKKLIPTLLEYGDKIIITVDDDMIYSKYLIENLLSGYRSNGNIQCTKASIPLMDGSSFKSYNEWLEVDKTTTCDSIIPIGVGGVLYPPQSLAKETTDESSFMKLAPLADDLWFWVMAKRRGSKHSFVSLKGKNFSFDTFYQFFHKGSALTHSNAKENQNDIQLKNILHQFPI